MAQYYLLEDMFDNLFGGTIQSTADVGGALPFLWMPSPMVDPVDQAAIAAYFAAGPRPRGLIRQRWTQFPIRAPIYNWTQTNGIWSLSGITKQPPGLVVFLVSEDGKILVDDTTGRPLGP